MRAAWWVLSLMIVGAAHATDIERLKALPLEDLAALPVSIASRAARPLRDTAAAVYVLTREDIQRSPADSLPGLLREVPGLNVARIDANTWAVSIRGFNGRYANKLLVLIDGRSIYTSLFSGVSWGLQDLPMEEIERIEVIRGPGASVWGANALNGVINIITRASEDTPGSLVGLTVGDGGSYRFVGRHGGELGERVDYRLWGQQRWRRDGHFENGERAYDHALDQRLGLRIDGLAGDDDDFLISAGLYRDQTAVTANRIDLRGGQTRPERSNNQSHGGFLLARLHHARTDGGWSAQFYYDHNYYDATRERERVIDIEFQDERPFEDRHRLTWGLGFRWLEDEVIGLPGFVRVTPMRHSRRLYSLFAEDEILLDPDWTLNLSTRAEYSSVSGASLQPAARLLWQPRAEFTLWASLASASRIPAVAEGGIFAPVFGTPPSAASGDLAVIGAFTGNPDFDAERMTSFELGCRREWSRHLSLDIAAFHAVYHGLRSIEPGAPDFTRLPGAILVPLNVDDRLDAWSRGIEVSADWRFSTQGRLRVNGTLLDLNRRPRADSRDIVARPGQNNSPSTQFNLMLSTRPAPDWWFDARLRHVGALPADTERIDAYWALDLQLLWKPVSNLSLALKARNLFGGGGIEFRDELNQRTSSTREGPTYAVNLTWTFE